MNPLQALHTHGQSVWLDYIRRSLLTSGELGRLIKEDGLRGVTSNPAIFEKAITGSTDYTEILRALAPQYQDAKTLYEQVAIRDIQDATDVLKPVYEQTQRRDGYVSLEVSPHLAHDTQGTLEEARRLWRAVGRDNLMIKVPATPEGIPAIEQLISEGTNVNVTLLFSQDVYERVANAYIAGLGKRAAQGGDVSHVASVASFFISRIDTAIDAMLTAKLKTATDASERALVRSLLGKVAIANAKLTYQRYQELFRGDAWLALAKKGAKTQRVLWASTSAKNPNYRDVVYVEELIGPDTVNTIPPATFDAFRDHGRVRASLTEGLEEAYDTMEALEQVGISMAEVTDRLLKEGVQLFAEPFDKLLAAVDKTRQAAANPTINRQTYTLPEPLAKAVRTSLEEWRAGDKVRQLWARDATLWTGSD
jgi:transaldolase/glucose-6-phosphate isomerase